MLISLEKYLENKSLDDNIISLFMLTIEDVILDAIYNGDFIPTKGILPLKDIIDYLPKDEKTETVLNKLKPHKKYKLLVEVDKDILAGSLYIYDIKIII